MRVIIVGAGNQGGKRAKVAGPDLVATVDPVNASATFKTVEQASLDSYDAALVCAPDAAKPKILAFLLTNKKHVLVEKPLIGETDITLQLLKELAERGNVVCYTAYNHRFEPHILRLKRTLDAKWLGRIYQVKFFYGNGTARDVRNSAWRDTGLGVLPDLGSHLLDWTLMLFGKPTVPPRVWGAHRFENRAFDHYHFTFQGEPVLDYEMTMLSWRNTFRFDLFAEHGSVHIDLMPCSSESTTSPTSSPSALSPCRMAARKVRCPLSLSASPVRRAAARWPMQRMGRGCSVTTAARAWRQGRVPLSPTPRRTTLSWRWPRPAGMPTPPAAERWPAPRAGRTSCWDPTPSR